MRESAILENISKLNTFVNMVKSNEFLSIYVEKITNNRSKNLKFINDFDTISLDLLYTSLQILNDRKVTKEDYNKLDKKELKYYLDKTKGINFFKKQITTINTEEKLISYLVPALSNGEYVCNNNSTIKFDNGLVVDSDWIVEFASFLITSLNNNINLSSDSMTYSFKTVSIPKDRGKTLKAFIKDIKLYEYVASKKGNRKLNYQDVKYLIDILSDINDYDFKHLQDINSKLSKDNYSLSINKKSIVLNKDDRTKLEKLYNEEEYDEVIKEFIQDKYNCQNSASNKNRRRLINNYELLRSLSHAYKSNYSLDECRKLFDIKEEKEELKSALAISNFYINYIYDKNNLNKYFNYATFKLEDLKPNIIDYETPEYKSIIRELSELNKKGVTINRKINKYLNLTKDLPEDAVKELETNTSSLNRNCRELERIIKEIKILKAKLEDAKDVNRQESNKNKTKINYIIDAIINGKYTFDKDTSIMTFDSYNPKDYHHSFHLELSINEFIEILLSDYNRNVRINFYQI